LDNLMKAYLLTGRRGVLFSITFHSLWVYTLVLRYTTL
jgi:hypothetical protein